MIEVQDDDVGLAAVDAGMCSEVLPEQRPVLLPITPDPRDLLPDVGRAIP
jgi:hypothetical protein